QPDLRRAAAARGAKNPAVVTLARSSLVRCLLDLVERRTPVHRPWLREIAGATAVSMLETAFADASRRVGTAALAVDHAERSTLAALGVDWSLHGWHVDDVVRVALL